MTMAKVGARFQVVIPRRERQVAGIRAGQQVQVRAEGRRIIVQSVSSSGLRGLGKDLRGGGDATAYVRRLRREWGARG